jgi:hypothetical protein
MRLEGDEQTVEMAEFDKASDRQVADRPNFIKRD